MNTDKMQSIAKKMYGQYPLLFLNILILSLSLGIYTAQKTTVPYECLFLLLIVNFAAAFISVMQKRHYSFIFCITLFFIIGLLRTQTALYLPPDNISRLAGQNIAVEGIVDSEPRITQAADGSFKASYIISVLKVKEGTDTAKASGKIYVYTRLKDKQKTAQPGDEISCSGTLRLIHGYQNPGQIDRSMAALGHGIYASLSTGKRPIEIKTPHDDSFSLQRLSADIRQNLLTALQKAMPPQDAALLFAMLFGGYGDIEPELLEAFTITGIVHILSVSGSHISLLAGFLLSLGRLLHFSNRFNLVLLVSVITFYAMLCGFAPPVLRASVMGLLSAAALAMGKTSEARHLLSITALIMLMISPLLLFSVSFQLSFAATAGLLYIMPPLQRAFSFLPRFIADNAALTISAQAAAIPLTAWYFSSISPSSIVANLLAVPVLEFIIILGIIGAVAGIIAPFLQHLIFILASLTLGIASEITMQTARLPWARIYIPAMPMICIFLYYTALFILLKPSLRRCMLQNIKRLRCAFAAILFICIIFAVYTVSQPQKLQVHFIDVGQGDAALIITPKNRSVLIDTGGTVNSDFDIGKRVVLPYLRHYGIAKLDYLILSHSDADHSGGASSILKAIPVHHLMLSDETDDKYAEALHLAPDNPVIKNAVKAKADTAFSLDGVQFKILAGGINSAQASSNEASNVIKLTYHYFSALFTGDISKEREQELLTNVKPDIMNITVLKVAHHGSNTSSSEDFLRAVSPRFAVISAGRYNSFGHPHPEVISRISSLPAKILRTDEHGAIVFYTDGYDLQKDTFIK